MNEREAKKDLIVLIILLGCLSAILIGLIVSKANLIQKSEELNSISLFEKIKSFSLAGCNKTIVDFENDTWSSVGCANARPLLGG